MRASGSLESKTISVPVKMRNLTHATASPPGWKLPRRPPPSSFSHRGP